jgi:hypothetical protein
MFGIKYHSVLIVNLKLKKISGFVWSVSADMTLNRQIIVDKSVSFV